MANVVTQVDIMKYSGMDKVTFPIGTIITPSARDWAAENNITLVIGEHTGSIDRREQDLFLKQVIASITQNMSKTCKTLNKDEMITVVSKCLEKMGCNIKD